LGRTKEGFGKNGKKRTGGENRKLKDVADLSFFYFYVQPNSLLSVKSTYLPD